jgi:GNAT superfamily N-acetyltransferase
MCRLVPTSLGWSGWPHIVHSSAARARGQTVVVDEILLAYSASEINKKELAGFFVGWPEPPPLARRVDILNAADEIVVARTSDGSLIGFITAITDRSFAAYIPLLEVLPDWQERGIGRRLVTAMLDRLKDCYMIDLVCDDDVASFYERLGGTRLTAVSWRNYDNLDRRSCGHAYRAVLAVNPKRPVRGSGRPSG